MRYALPRIFLVVTATAVIIAVLSAAWAPFIARASIAQFYPSTCLGGWEHTEQASGVPEAMEDGGAPVFTIENAAMLRADTHAQIYCGGFSGETIADTVPSKITVRFSWAVEYPPIESPREDTPFTPEGSTESGVPEDVPTVEEPAVPTEEVSEDIPAEESSEVSLPSVESTPEPEPEPEPEQPSEPVSFFRSLFPVVHAQEITEELPVEEESSEEVVIEEPVEPYGIVEVLYTLDGTEWKSLGFVGADEFSGTSFEIPIAEASLWEDISRIQIGVRSIPILDGVVPTIYLDSVWLEATYQPPVTEEVSPVEEVVAVIGEVLGETIEQLLDPEEAPLEEELPKDTLVIEPVDIELVSTVPPHVYTRDIIIDPLATHTCTITPFTVDMSGREKLSTDVMFSRATEGEYRAEIGSLPPGIVVRFSKNDDYVYKLTSTTTSLSLDILTQEFAGPGNFSVPVVFTRTDGPKNSSVVCQVNIIHSHE